MNGLMRNHSTILPGAEQVDPNQFKLHSTKDFDTISLTTATWEMLTSLALGDVIAFFLFSLPVFQGQKHLEMRRVLVCRTC